MAFLPIKVHPDPVLRAKCATVETFDEELKRLAEDMIQTMNAAPGVGLAACQIGREIRLAIVDPSAGEDPDSLHVLVNPEIVESDGEWVFEEGCLSAPGLSWEITRPKTIHVVGRDLDGNELSIEADELEARLFQHELDHLDGVARRALEQGRVGDHEISGQDRQGDILVARYMPV